jgi:hypothetical protein
MQRFGSAARLACTLCTLWLLLLLGACGSIAPSGFSEDVDALLVRAEAWSQQLSTRNTGELSEAEVIALGYLERGRLGLGSPFRLIDFAMRDPELPEDVREQVAYALLAQAVHGRGYEIDPMVLESARLTGVPAGLSVGPEHLRLIERAVLTAPSATSGERAVRLGFMLAEAERTVEGAQQTAVANVAAMVADRRRAREDALVLLRAATQRRAAPVDLIPAWRRELRFRVEAPALTAVTVREEEAEARDGAQLALGLRALAQRLSAPGAQGAGGAGRHVPAARSYLLPATARRLQEIALARNYPAQAPIAVAVAINRDAFLGRPGLRRWERLQRERFADNSWNEELFAAGVRALRASGAGVGQRLPLIEVQAATFLRVWNQEEPWFPGDPAPAARDLEGRFGLAAVRFDADVDESWRPYYLRMLGRGLGDLQRVLPTASLRGLTIHVGALPHEMRALALHEPRTRTLYLPPQSGAGTIAHEIAHDLDWQLARRRYGLRGAYATDLAVKDQRGDRIATAMTGLAAALARPGTDNAGNRHDTRPAEVFARGLDWFVAAALASEGRSGGYLTSFQDPLLTGYGTTRSPDIGGGAVPALFAILDPIAPVVDRTREWALDAYGPIRSLSAFEISRAVTAAGADLPPEQRIEVVAGAGRRSLLALSHTSCRLSSAEGLRRLTTAQRALVLASTGAAARGAAIDGVRALAREHVGEDARDLADAWLGWRLYGAPEPLDPRLDEWVPVFEDLLLRAETVAREEAAAPGSAFEQFDTALICGGNPFASQPFDGRLGGASAQPLAPWSSRDRGVAAR